MHTQDHFPGQAASACSEFLAPNDEANATESWRAALLHAKAVAWSALWLFLMVLVLWSAKP